MTSEFGERNGIAPVRYEVAHYGAFGSVETRGGLLVCHICGREFKNLGLHAFQRHGLPASEYRAAYGLNVGHGLVADATKRRLAESSARAPQTALLRTYGPPPAERALAGAKRRRALEWAIQVGNRNRGRAMSPEQKALLSVAGRAQSAKRSASAKAQWAVRSTEERSAMLRAARAAQGRRTVCANGHALEGANRLDADGGRCRTCRNARAMERYRANRDAETAKRRADYHAKYPEAGPRGGGKRR